MLIGLIGQMGSGKDTVARIIQAIDLYRTYFKDLKLIDENTFIHNCLSPNYYQELKDRNYNSKYENHSFADNLKMCIAIIMGIDRECLDDREFKNSDTGLGTTEPISYRRLLQLFGTEVGRVISPNIWIDSLFKNYRDNCNWIITDVRFENEADAIIRKGGILFRINREYLTKEDVENQHASESGLFNYPSVAEDIMNTGSMDDLIDRIKVLMEKYKI